MPQLITRPSWRRLIIAAGSGLFIGTAIYLALLLRVESENRALREYQRAGGDIMHLTLALKWWVLPLIALLGFTIGCALLQMLLKRRRVRRQSKGTRRIIV